MEQIKAFRGGVKSRFDHHSSDNFEELSDEARIQLVLDFKWLE